MGLNGSLPVPTWKQDPQGSKLRPINSHSKDFKVSGPHLLGLWPTKLWMIASFYFNFYIYLNPVMVGVHHWNSKKKINFKISFSIVISMDQNYYAHVWYRIIFGRLVCECALPRARKKANKCADCLVRVPRFYACLFNRRKKLNNIEKTCWETIVYFSYFPSLWAW